MADTPTPRSYQQTLGDMFDAFLSNQGINSLRVGGPIVSILEAAAQSDTRNSQDIFNLLTSNDLDNATGLALARKGADEQVPKLEITPATGTVTISDTSFTKKSTNLFQGAPAPIVGSGVTSPINVVDADSFPSSGSIYIGRGTNNYEGPLVYTSKVNAGNHWELTLASPGTTRFHNTSETVILAQGGNRVVGPNTVIRTPQASTSTAVEFRTLFQVTLPDGETEVPAVEVVAETPGQIGNVIAGAIREFVSSPFTGAAVTNPTPYTNGRETESDDEYRERIRAVRASRQLGTKLAIETSVTGITAFDENKRINSASLVKRYGFPATLYVDDGTGYEEKTAAVAFESLMDDATGGESHFQTTQRPVARAYVQTTNSSPFVLRSSDQLSVKVGGTVYTHPFDEEDFHSISNASAFEVVASINSNPDIAFVARTAEQGTKVVIFANADTNEDIEVVDNVGGTNGNDGLSFPAGVGYTMRLYKNDRLLFKDGRVAQAESLSFASWDAVTGTQTLVISVDGTPPLTISFDDQAFIDANTGYATAGRNSLAAWAAVINANVPGVTCVINSGKLVLTSNAGPVEKAALDISGGTLVTAHFFPTISVQGRVRDYTLDRNEAQIVLSQVLEAGDRLTAGSFATRAFFESDDLSDVDLAADAHLWWVVDGRAEIIEHGVTSTTNLAVAIQKSDDFGNVMTITAGANVFTNVQAQDWMIIWDDAAPASLRGVHRIADASPTVITIERHTANLTMRSGHTSTSLNGTGAVPGLVLTCGGGITPRTAIAGVLNQTVSGVLATTELYDYDTQTVTAARPMNQARGFHTATKLANGKVVVIGGVDTEGVVTDTIETYDPALNTWTTSAVTLTTARKNHTATLLTDNRILIAGGDTGSTATDKYQIYTPGADTIDTEQSMVKARSLHCAVKLPDDNVLIAGGYDAANVNLVNAELFTPGADTTAATGSMTVARANFGMELVGTDALPPTKVIAVGNDHELTNRDTWQTYDIAGGTWSATTAAGNLRFATDNLVRLTNGHVVGLDGYDNSAPESAIGFTYDGTTFTNITAQPPSVTDLGGPRFNTQIVEIKSGDGTTIKNIVASIGGSFYHGTAFFYMPTAVLNTYNEPGIAWDAPDSGVDPTVVLADIGIAFVRSDAFVQDATIPTGSNYTADSLAEAFNDELFGASATVYKTTKLRINTNTFDDTGDVALVTQDLEAEAILLEPGDAIENIVPHLGAVMSGNSDLGTPSFEDVRVVSQEYGTPHSKPVVTSTVIGHDYALVGLKNWARGGDGTSTYHTDAWTQARANSNYKFATRLKTRTEDSALVSSLETRDDSVQPWGPWDRVYAASPYAISPNGNLEILVDNDNDKHYSINLYRTLTTIGTTYGASNDFKDGDAGAVSLAETFGLDYDFNDMAVYMPSRAIAFSGDAARRMIFRFYRLGPDGDGARVRFGNPSEENADLTSETELISGSPVFSTTFRLRSGAPRTPVVHNTTRVGRAVTSITAGGTGTIVHALNLAISSASRTTNVTTVTLTLPTGITNHGITAASKVWVESTDPNFSSGLKTVTSVTATTILYAETAADQGATANIGTLSFDSQGEASYTGSGVVALDFIRVNDPTNSVTLDNMTFQVASVPAGGHYITALTGDELDGSLFSPQTTLTWTPIVDTDYFKLFANSPQTATAVVAAINALRDETGSTSPIKATEIGTGLDDIEQNSCDENDDSQFWYTLADGINWVKETTSPVSIAGDYTLEFKAPITSSLATNADWENEEVRIVPITTKNLVDWLNTPTVTGLWTVTDIEEAGEGHHLQISTILAGSDGGVEVQGGLADSVTAPIVGTPIPLGGFYGNTIRLLDGEGLHSGMWVRIENETPQPKSDVFGFFTDLVSWTADGLVTLGIPITVEQVAPTQMRVQFEKQGNFIAISDIGAMTAAAFGIVEPGAWLRISEATSPTIDQVQAANQGLFRVLRIANSVGGNSGTLYIENSSAIEETSECILTVYSPGSVMPGDKLVVVGDLWGVDNIGTWDVKAVGETTAGSGDVFATNDRFTVDVSTRTPVPHGAATFIGTDNAIYMREGSPAVYLMRIAGLSINQEDGDFLDLVWDQAVVSSSISGANGSIVQVQDKLAFPRDFNSGADGYRYDTGLLREANRVVYGDPSDNITYPGVAAADSHINIQGPLVKRIQVAVSVRVKTGLKTQDIENRVRSAVATVINKSPIGQAIAFSDIIDAARDVVGVTSVTIASPLFNVGHDQISVQPYEKPFVIDLVEDIQVSFLGL